MNLNPRYRFTFFPVGDQLQDLRAFADTGYRVVTSHAFANAGYAGNRRSVGIDVAVLARNLVVRGMDRVTEFDWLNRTAIGEIFAVYPCAYKQSEHEHKPEQGWLLPGPERIENRDRQFVPPSIWGKSLPVSCANYKLSVAFVLEMFPAWYPRPESANPEAGDTHQLRELAPRR